MPRVPILGGNRVQETATPGVRVSGDAPASVFGADQSAANVGRAAQGAISKIGGELIRVQKEEKKRADDIQIMSAVRQATEFETRALRDPKTGALNTKGKNAFGATDSTLKSFEEESEFIKSGLKNDDQRFAYERASQSIKLGMQKKLLSHESKQQQVFDVEETQAFVMAEKQAAVENYEFPDRLEDSIDRQKEAIFLSATRNGMPDEARDQLVKSSVSSTHKDIISRMLTDNKDELAKTHLKNNGKELLPGDFAQIEKAIDEATLRGDSQRETDKIIAKTDDLSIALEQARDIEDPRKRDEVVRRVKTRIADQRLAKQDSERKNYDTAFQVIEQTQNIDEVPPNVMASLSLNAKQSLEKRAAQLRNGLAVVTDIKELYNLEQLAGTPSTRNTFLRTNLNEKAHLLSESDFKRFARMQSDLRSKGGSKELDGIETKNSIVQNALLAAGFETGRSADTDDIEKGNKFKREVDRLVVERQEATGKKITNEDLRKLTDELMTEVVTRDIPFDFGLFTKKKKVFELESGDVPRLQAEDIPSDITEEITSVLRRKNIPVTEDNILQLYVRKLNRGKDGK